MAGGGDITGWAYSYVESLIVIVLVCFGLLFEACHHSLVHWAERSYDYGSLQEELPLQRSSIQGHGAGHEGHAGPLICHKPLFTLLTSRISAEFMVLGWLAFLIFCFREAHGFEWVARVTKDEKAVPLPKSAEDWLHMVEIVHMKLFLAMILYCVVISCVVTGSVRNVRAWEEMRVVARAGAGSVKASKTQLRRYMTWRSNFVDSLMHWRHRRPHLYRQLLQKLKLDVDEHCHDSSAARRELDRSLVFSAYLAQSVGVCTQDTVCIRRQTWYGLLILFSAFALLHRFAHVVLLDLMPIFIVAAFVLLFALRYAVYRMELHLDEPSCQQRGLGQSDAAVAATANVQDVEPSEYLHERYRTELWVLRFLQLTLMILSYACARTLADTNDWREQPLAVLSMCTAFAVLFLLLAKLLPSTVPSFSALMAMPPYMNDMNVGTFFKVLADFGQLCIEKPESHVTAGESFSKEPVTGERQVNSRRRNWPGTTAGAGGEAHEEVLQACDRMETVAEEMSRSSRDLLAVAKALGTRMDSMQSSLASAQQQNMCSSLEAVSQLDLERSPAMSQGGCRQPAAAFLREGPPPPPSVPTPLSVDWKSAASAAVVSAPDAKRHTLQLPRSSTTEILWPPGHIACASDESGALEDGGHRGSCNRDSFIIAGGRQVRLTSRLAGSLVSGSSAG
mmetsp:Transcript_54400/g.129643  ORF Transcript_54400/g.129643 Transcript_54400/m.129643 type:complete len:677 (-) Transcript_54400:137-2167(-)